MTTPGSPQGRLVTGVSLEEPERLAVAGGHAVLFTAASPGRDTNEDAAGLFPLGIGAGSGGVLAVADGVGGLPAGESASREVLSRLWDALLAADPAAESLRGPILDGIEAANQALIEAGTGAATTLAVAELRGRELRTFHVGDAAILLVGQRGRIKLQTVAHSPVGYAQEAGLLDEREALQHDERHLISNAVGTSDMRIEIGSPVKMAPRDTLLLATDGVLDNLRLQEIVDAIRTGPLEEGVEAIRRTSRRRMLGEESGPSKPDDATLVVFRP
ncbi:MAG: serine/threonine-protein phosphatase [bacterium]|nr:serine/threonine-protein phosphatase [bacterium]MCP5069016.1 serine/threonine-protein phosphatase [bacterium]